MQLAQRSTSHDLHKMTEGSRRKIFEKNKGESMGIWRQIELVWSTNQKVCAMTENFKMLPKHISTFLRRSGECKAIRGWICRLFILCHCLLYSPPETETLKTRKPQGLRKCTSRARQALGVPGGLSLRLKGTEAALSLSHSLPALRP